MIIKPGIIIANRYEILNHLGSGSTSIVYKARDRKLAREVTIKILKNEFINKNFIKRFITEARAVASLNHINIVNAYDIGDNELYYIVMEYIDGITLKELIKRRAPFNNKEIINVAMQIASALSHAHEHNIIHRDIKPQNILISERGKVKVTDFGIAKTVTAKTITVVKNSMGSVHYFSPEQAKGSFITLKTDIYSLGIVMFEMATGKLPFDGDSSVSVAMKQISEELPDIKKINEKITIELEKIIIKATQKFATNRYENAQEFVIDLKLALSKIYDNNNSSQTNADASNNLSSIILTREEIDIIKKEILENDLETLESKKLLDVVEDKEYEQDLLDYRSKEKKVVIAATVISIVLMLIITFVCYKIFFIPKLVSVPNLIGMTYEEALKASKELRIKINIIGSENNSEISRDRISSQDYNYGDNIRRGDIVNIKLSLGAEKILVPNVVNKDLNEAYEIFGNKFEIDEIYEFSSTVPNNVVIKQSPNAGEFFDETEIMKLYISKGKEIKSVRVPNIIGLTESQAKTKLHSLELIPGTIEKKIDINYQSGIVISQSIAEGTELQTGSIINFVVNAETLIPIPSPSIIVQPITTSVPVIIDPPKQDEIITSSIVPEITKTLIIDLKNINDEEFVHIITSGDESSIHLRILYTNFSNVQEIFYDKEVNIKDFPVKFEISKEKQGTYQIFILDKTGKVLCEDLKEIKFN
ncbi:MAG: Stk1 family PASTA domain-containing Ser/Thr kinase [Clostridiales bacterium]|jgi:serine/threonine-protein kinase|nr:Stk1 family PASTA domain-containing Ser/Thr kinase [Clostridiales bacterium]